MQRPEFRPTPRSDHKHGRAIFEGKHQCDKTPQSRPFPLGGNLPSWGNEDGLRSPLTLPRLGDARAELG